MKKIIFFLVLIQFAACQILFAQSKTTNKGQYQITGTIVDAITKEPMFGVNVMLFSLENPTLSKAGSATDFNGKYTINTSSGTYILKCQSVGFQEIVDTIDVNTSLVLDYKMTDKAEVLDEVVVSAGKYEQKISDITVSMEILKPSQLENKNTYDLTEALNKLGGVDMNDGQISIRSSSGWSYGAGSRVIVLMDELPIMTADAGDMKWDFIPMENIAQVEVIKGAASALFGSAALGGIINLRSAYPGPKPETNISYFVGVYGNPSDERWKWWGEKFYNGNDERNPIEILGRKTVYYFFRAPMYSGITFNHKQQFGNCDLVIGGNHFANEGYRITDFSKNTRFNANVRYRSRKVEGLAVGVNSNFMAIANSDFLFWKSDTTPFLSDASKAFPTEGFCFNADPFVYYYSKHSGKFSLRTRYWHRQNVNEDTTKNTLGHTFYTEFQYNNTFAKYWTLTTGIVNSYSIVIANLFDDHTSNNLALYGQLDVKIKRLKLSGGLRLENYRLDRARTELLFNKIPIKPVFKLGANFELAKATFLRASIGQGYRFPSIAEKFTATSVSAATIYANPNLKAETGWSAEIGIKQGFSINNKWKGFADLSIYHQQIKNMIEFGFGLFDPHTKKEIPFIIDSINAAFDRNIAVPEMIGFQAKNIGNVLISGVDLSAGISGKVNKAIISGTLSYNYNYPIYKNGIDQTTSTTTNILKYRFKHSVKTEIQVDSRRFIIGASFEWKSKVTNIDRMFCDEREPENPNSEEYLNSEDAYYMTFSNTIIGPTVLPGYVEYRKAHASDNFVNLDVNFGFKFSHNIKTLFIVRNVFNQTFSTRPGYIISPRRFEMSLSVKI